MVPPDAPPLPVPPTEILQKYKPGDVALRLNQLPLDKAVPLWSLPGAAYRSVSDALSIPLCQVWNTTATTGLLPYSWDALQLILIPKPGQTPHWSTTYAPFACPTPYPKHISPTSTVESVLISSPCGDQQHTVLFHIDLLLRQF